jgi:hypothetical protein
MTPSLSVLAVEGTARHLVEQLRKRKVFKVAAGYAVVGWLAMQVADVMFPALGLPTWTVTLAASLLITGFPVALTLDWMFDVTPEGIRVDTGTVIAARLTSGDFAAQLLDQRAVAAAWPDSSGDEATLSA